MFVRVGATVRADWSAAIPLIILPAIRVTLSPSGAETMALARSCECARVACTPRAYARASTGEIVGCENLSERRKSGEGEAVTNDRRSIADPNLESRVAISKEGTSA